MTKDDIHEICKKYDITNYIINDDMSIDVHGIVVLFGEIIELPLNFNKVTGTFICEKNRLISLKGAPNYVGGNFICDHNFLTSLKYGPEYVKFEYVCNSNNITSLKHIGHVGNEIFCVDNKIKTFEKLNTDKAVFFDNPINELWNLFRNKSHIDYFNELDIIQENGNVVILDRLNYFLQDIDKKEVEKEDIKSYKVI